MVDATVDRFGALDVLCANAGGFPQTKIVDMDPKEWDDVMGINLRSAFWCVKAAIPYFEKADKGRVVLTSSITGQSIIADGYRKVRELSRTDEEEIDTFVMLRRMALCARMGSYKYLSRRYDQYFLSTVAIP